MVTAHECWWTRTRRSEVTDVGEAVTGAGLPREVLEQAALLLGQTLMVRPSESDEYGEDLEIGGIASGAAHDGCFVQLESASPEIKPALKRALIEAILDLHATWIGAPVDWSGVLPSISERSTEGMTMRFRSHPRRRRLRIRIWPSTAGFLARTLSSAIDVDCSRGRAVLL